MTVGNYMYMTISVNFSLNVPLDTQKAWIYLLDQRLLHFRHFVLWAEAIIYKNWITDTSEAKIHSLQLVFVLPNQITILTPSKLDDYFFRPIAFQPVTILNVWRVNCHVQLIKNVAGSFLQIIITNSIWNTGDF